nr:HemK2/MTQ2 family protein methyltransferase [Methanosphaerula palustris]
MFLNDQVYQPEADTLLLCRVACSTAMPDDRVLEVGTGSGYVAAALKDCCTVVGLDINPHAVMAAKARGVEVVRSDLCAGFRGPFDLILFNPPYLPTLPEERIDDWLEYALDGGLTGRDVIARFAAEVGRVLAPEGRILLLISSLTGYDEVAAIFTGLGFQIIRAADEQVCDELLSVLCIRRA